MPYLDGIEKWQKERYQMVIKKYGQTAYDRAVAECCKNCARYRKCSDLALKENGSRCRPVRKKRRGDGGC